MIATVHSRLSLTWFSIELVNKLFIHWRDALWELGQATTRCRAFQTRNPVIKLQRQNIQKMAVEYLILIHRVTTVDGKIQLGA